jgi:hypothetical protein
MFRFRLRIKHDRGWVTIETMATDEGAARRAVMAAEGCPDRAIRGVRAVGASNYEMLASDPTQHRKLAVTNQRERFSKNGQTRADKVPTAREVQVLDDHRWRRVYTTRKADVYYVILDGLRVVIDMSGAAS